MEPELSPKLPRTEVLFDKNTNDLSGDQQTNLRDFVKNGAEVANKKGNKVNFSQDGIKSLSIYIRGVLHVISGTPDELEEIIQKIEKEGIKINNKDGKLSVEEESIDKLVQDILPRTRVMVANPDGSFDLNIPKSYKKAMIAGIDNNGELVSLIEVNDGVPNPIYLNPNIKSLDGFPGLRVNGVDIIQLLKLQKNTLQEHSRNPSPNVLREMERACANTGCRIPVLEKQAMPLPPLPSQKSPTVQNSSKGAGSLASTGK